MHLAIDIMGGDQPLEERIQACNQALQQFPDLKLSLVGDIQHIQEHLAHNNQPHCSIIAAETTVSMTDKPAQAIRHKMNSSMSVALQLVADQSAGACLSAGNTGALVGLSTKLLGCSNAQLSRPAICTALPHASGRTWLLDMGANINCSGQQLHQFALLANKLCRKMDHIAFPKIGLLNIGKEQIKGTEAIQAAQQLIKQEDQLNYCGYAEGDDILSGAFNIIVCDGLLGNVALKSTEGTANFLLQQIQQLLDSEQPASGQSQAKNQWQQRFNDLLQKFSPQKYNGAILLGVNGLVIKSHGMANCESFFNAIAISRQMMLANSGDSFNL